MRGNRSFVSTEEYRARRRSLAAELQQNAIAIVPGRTQTGAFDIFRQNNEFYYLSGVDVPQAYMVIVGVSGLTTLYLPPRDKKMERSEGVSWNADQAERVRAETGIDRVGHYADLESDLAGSEIVYCPQLPGEGRQMCRDTMTHASKARAADPWDGGQSREGRFASELVRRIPGVELRELLPLLDRMRGCKSTAEIELMRQAGEMTALAVREAMKSTRAGCFEYQLAAVAEYVFRVNGALGGAYRPIVASGQNIWNAHYYRNNCPLLSGDLVLMDYAPDIGYYTSDIGRMWPVNGVYAPWQRELYGFIVQYHQALLGSIRPGLLAGEIENEAAQVMRPIAEKTNWSRPAFRKAALATLDFHGHLSHGVGMAVHDVWNYRQEPLKPGVVLALDPQMWVAEEELYIRVEDTVAITEDGFENLTAAAPLELDEVERLMQEPGLLERLSTDVQID